MNWLQNGSWKTTSAGLLTIAGGIVRFIFACKSGNITEESVMTTLTAIAGGIGLLYARDNDKSTEQVQAAKTGNIEQPAKIPTIETKI